MTGRPLPDSHVFFPLKTLHRTRLPDYTGPDGGRRGCGGHISRAHLIQGATGTNRVPSEEATKRSGARNLSGDARQPLESLDVPKVESGAFAGLPGRAKA